MWRTLRNLIFGGVASKVLLGVANIFIIKYLSKQDYAQVANFLFIQSMISGLFFSPFLLSSVVGANLFGVQNSRRLFSALNLIQICLVTVLFLAALGYGESLSVDLFKKTEFYHSLILGLLSSVFLTFQNVILSQHQANESYKTYNIINILRPLILILMLVGLKVTDMLNFWTTSMAFLISILLSVGGELRFLMEAIRLKGLIFRFKQFVWFWKTLQYLILFFFIRATLDHVATFMVNRYFSLDDNASYGVAFRYYAMVDLIIFSAHIAFINSFTKDEESVSKRKFVNWIKATGAVSVIGLALLFFAKPLFILINGEKYADAYPIFAAFMSGLVVYLCFSPVIYGMARKKAFKLLFILSLIAFVFQLGMTAYAAHIQSLVLMAAVSVMARGFIYLSSVYFYFRKA
jgi:O-antigen/teichoic acid export membrane protein